MTLVLYPHRPNAESEKTICLQAAVMSIKDTPGTSGEALGVCIIILVHGLKSLNLLVYRILP